jgi:crossover junction endodeoxyribonuclease RuvC
MSAPTSIRVIGLDLSLASTGIAINTGGPTITTTTIRPKAKMRGFERLDHILEQIIDYTHSGLTDLVVIEGPSYGSTGAGGHERAGLWWLAVRSLHHRGVPYAIASPKSRAKYASGRGDANKREVIAGITQLCPWWDARKRTGLDDEADALSLCAMGCDQLGCPVFQAPQSHRDALTGVEWPANLVPA